MADVAVKLEADGEEKNGTFTPSVGTQVDVDFDPLETSVKVDYSRPDALSISLSGDLALKTHGLSLGLEGDAATDGSRSVSGRLTWEIDKNVSANAQITYGTGGTSGTATLTIRF
ncbi:MAG TPA: hypothetical protein VGP64_06460 [Polyangia bacterium]|jgi:hypothetical protein